LLTKKAIRKVQESEIGLVVSAVEVNLFGETIAIKTNAALLDTHNEDKVIT
jgi:hypothetical protein